MEENESKKFYYDKNKLFSEKCKSNDYKETNKKSLNTEKLIGNGYSKRRKNILAVASSFKSDKELIAQYISQETHKENFLPCNDVNIEDVKFDKTLDRKTKAALLCKKYRHKHPLLKKFVYKKLTSRMVDLVFEIVNEIKYQQGL